MLSPSRHSHPDQTVVAMSLKLLQQLRKKRVLEYESLLANASKTVKGGDFLFLPAIHFLFVLGLIEYRPKTDCFEYVGQQE